MTNKRLERWIQIFVFSVPYAEIAQHQKKKTAERRHVPDGRGDGWSPPCAGFLHPDPEDRGHPGQVRHPPPARAADAAAEPEVPERPPHAVDPEGREEDLPRHPPDHLRAVSCEMIMGRDDDDVLSGFLELLS